MPLPAMLAMAAERSGGEDMQRRPVQGRNRPSAATNGPDPRPDPSLRTEGGASGAAARAGRAGLPAVDRVLHAAGAAALIAEYGRALVRDAVRAALAARRRAGAAATPEEILVDSAAALARLMQPSQRPVFNLTGTVLHTNLGRAPLPQEAIAAAAAAMRAPSTLEYDLDSGRRGERDDHVAGWLTRLTGAEAALVVNNNAAALVLALNTLALGRETIVSRGELIEIGGSFRLPEIMARAGTRLIEVGTTNRTHLSDFAAAIGPETGLILKAHTSNYAITGFTAAVPAGEPTVAEALTAGADLVTFSGDKLLGGPQAGLIAGRADLIARLARNPLRRALRLDKIRLAALAAVLRLYVDPDRLAARLPALRLLTRPAEEIAALAARLLPAVARAFAGLATVSAVATKSQIGSGALPVALLPSTALALRPSGPGPAPTESAGARRGDAAMALARRLRALPIPVIGRIEGGTVLLDLRCLEDEAAFLDQLERLAADTA